MSKELAHKLRNFLQTVQSLADLGEDECAYSLLTIHMARMKEIQKAVQSMADELKKEGL